MSYLLKGTIEHLAKLNPQELLSSMLQQAEYHKQEHGDAEQASWKKSLYRLIQLLQENDLGQLYLVAEYALLNERIDALLFGFKKGKTEILATIIELKQWQALAENHEQRVTEVNVKIYEQTEEYRMHPIYQTSIYKKQLENHHSYFQGKKGTIKTIQYLDQFEDDKAKFFKRPYEDYRGSNREDLLIVQREKNQLINFLKSWYETEQIDQQLLEKELEAFLQGHYVMGEVGLSGIKKILSGQDNAIMLDDQQEISAQIYLLFEKYKNNPKPKTVIIQGDPGTGKTIVGLHLLYLAQKRGMSKERCIFTFAKGRMLREVLEQESGIPSIPYINEINPHNYDVIVIDEAHRLPNPQETIRYCLNSGQNNIMMVFLVDDHQRLRLDEQGSVANLTQVIEELGITPYYFQLNTQKRSGFKDDYVNKVKHLLYGDPLPKQMNLGDFQIHVRSNLQEIDQELLELQKQGHTVKWFAPYCWEWKSQNKQQTNPDHRKQEDYDITIGNFKKQWNPKDSKKRNSANNQYDWYKGQKPHHFEQVGSVYTAQGLDYDYIGFIWWSDLKWNKEKQIWEADLEDSKDDRFREALLKSLEKEADSTKATEEILRLFLNQYYVLLTRARKGIYLWFKDQDTREYVEHLLKDKLG